MSAVVSPSTDGPSTDAIEAHGRDVLARRLVAVLRRSGVEPVTVYAPAAVPPMLGLTIPRDAARGLLLDVEAAAVRIYGRNRRRAGDVS